MSSSVLFLLKPDVTFNVFRLIFLGESVFTFAPYSDNEILFCTSLGFSFDFTSGAGVGTGVSTGAGAGAEARAGVGVVVGAGSETGSGSVDVVSVFTSSDFSFFSWKAIFKAILLSSCLTLCAFYFAFNFS